MNRWQGLLLCASLLVTLVDCTTLTMPWENVPAASPTTTDTHCHIVPPFYKALSKALNYTPDISPHPSWSTAELGFATSVIPVSTPGAHSSRDAPTEEDRKTSPTRIDTHCHIVPPFYEALLKSLNRTAGGSPIPSWSVAAHVAMNDRFRITTSIVSVSTPGAKLSRNAPADEGRALARQLNEYSYNITLEHPKRFLFFATLTLPDLDGAVAEAIYSLDTLKAAGVVVLANAFGELFGTPRYAPLYEVLNARNATVFIHPSDSPCPGGPNSPCPGDTEDPLNFNEFPPSLVDFLLDTTRAAINLVYENVTQEYPNIHFILAHSGGFLPFVVTRAAGGLALMSGQISDQPKFLERLANFNVDVALSASASALVSTTNFFGTSRVTYGTDFPFVPKLGLAMNNKAFEDFLLNEDGRRQIDFNNAHTLFRRFLV